MVSCFFFDALGVMVSDMPFENRNPNEKKEEIEPASELVVQMGWGSVKIDFFNEENVSNFENIVKEMLEKIGEKVIDQGATLIGHIKANVKVANNIMKANLIDLEFGVELSGNLPKKVEKGEISLLAVVQGLTHEVVQEIVEKITHEILEFSQIKFELEAHKHENHT
jgi:hypothetical protein